MNGVVFCLLVALLLPAGLAWRHRLRTPTVVVTLIGPAGALVASLARCWHASVLERLGVAASLVCGWPEGIAIVLAVKGLGRYPELQQGTTEPFIIGTFASVLFAAAACGVLLLAH